MTTDLGLADFISALREELQVAAGQSANEELRFRVGPIEIELEVKTTRDVKAKTGVRFWVVEAGADVGAAKGTTQKLKIGLTPSGARGSDWNVNDQLQKPLG